MPENVANSFGLSERDMNTIHNIFKKYPDVKQVHIFGSRAKGNFHSGSDIDLAIINDGLNPQTILSLTSDFEESSLPYKVDLVDFNTIKTLAFIEHIERVGVQFYLR